MIFNMGEDECDLFSEKLEDIHLVSTRKTSDQQSPNQSFKDFVQKTEAGSVDSTPCCTTNNWQQLFEDSLPPTSEDIVLPSIAHEDDFSLDLSHDMIYFGSSCQSNQFPNQNNSIATPIAINNAAFTANQENSSIPVTSNSPVMVNRSRPASPNPNEANGSEKKKAKFEKAECRDIACVSNIKMHFENQDLAQHLDGSVRKYSTGQSAIISSPIFENLSTSSIVIPDKAGRNLKAYQNSLSKSPVAQNFVVRKLSTGSTPCTIMASPDSTDRSLDVLQEYLTPSQRYSFHSRSVSTSPEPREDPDRRDGRRNGDGGKDKVPRHKRPSHIHAELRRRFKIQTCIDELNQMLPPAPGGSRSNTGGSKKSNAALLARAAGHCLQLKADVREASREADALRAEIEALTADINSYHQELPEDGVEQKTAVKSVSIEQMFEDYVQRRTWSNWKFYIFALLIRPFFETYCRVVGTTTVEQFLTTVVRWMQDHFTLSSFRTCTMPVFRHISTKTSFMVTPELLPQEVLHATMSSSPSSSACDIMTTESPQSRRSSLTLDSTLNTKRTDKMNNGNQTMR